MADLRDNLLNAADLATAADLAASLHDRFNELLNDAGITMATSLVARALFARAVIGTAAAWWADIGVPEPRTFAAIKSIVDDLPPELTPVCFVDPSILSDAG